MVPSQVVLEHPGYIFYRQTCQHKRSHKWKFVDDSVIVSLLSSRDCLSDCHRLVQVILLVAECLQDKRESYWLWGNLPEPFSNIHKFHGIVFDNRLTFEREVDADCTMCTAVDLLSMRVLLLTESMKMFSFRSEQRPINSGQTWPALCSSNSSKFPSGQRYPLPWCRSSLSLLLLPSSLLLNSLKLKMWFKCKKVCKSPCSSYWRARVWCALWVGWGWSQRSPLWFLECSLQTPRLQAAQSRIYAAQ